MQIELFRSLFISLKIRVVAQYEAPKKKFIEIHNKFNEIIDDSIKI